MHTSRDSFFNLTIQSKVLGRTRTIDNAQNYSLFIEYLEAPTYLFAVVVRPGYLWKRTTTPSRPSICNVNTTPLGLDGMTESHKGPCVSHYSWPHHTRHWKEMLLPVWTCLLLRWPCTGHISLEFAVNLFHDHRPERTWSRPWGCPILSCLCQCTKLAEAHVNAGRRANTHNCGGRYTSQLGIWMSCSGNSSNPTRLFITPCNFHFMYKWLYFKTGWCEHIIFRWHSDWLLGIFRTVENKRHSNLSDRRFAEGMPEFPFFSCLPLRSPPSTLLTVSFLVCPVHDKWL